MWIPLRDTLESEHPVETLLSLHLRAKILYKATSKMLCILWLIGYGTNYNQQSFILF